MFLFVSKIPNGTPLFIERQDRITQRGLQGSLYGLSDLAR